MQSKVDFIFLAPPKEEVIFLFYALCQEAQCHSDDFDVAICFVDIVFNGIYISFSSLFLAFFINC